MDRDRLRQGPPRREAFVLDTLDAHVAQSDHLLEAAERDIAILEVLLREGQARAYVLYCLDHPKATRIATAERLVNGAVAALVQAPMAGAIHHVQVLRTVGRLHRLGRHTTGWSRVTEEAHHITTDAGLLGQQREIERELQRSDAHVAS